MSLRYGCGDLHWFEKQTREDQAQLLAYFDVLDEERKGKGRDKADRSPEDLLRERAARLAAKRDKAAGR